MELGCCAQRCQHSSGLGSLWGSGTSIQHCTRTRAQRLLLPFSWAYTAPLQKSKQVFV